MDLHAQNIEFLSPEQVTPNARNPRTHSKKQINQIAAAIKEWGFTTALLIDENKTIIAGHGRHQAALQLGLDQVPCIKAEGWSDAKKMAYLLADNKLALNSEWDDELLQLELTGLQAEGFDIALTGFDDFKMPDIELEELEPEKYTDKQEAPTYEPKGDCPDIKDVYEHDKYVELMAKIDAADLEYEVADFLRLAATRHVKFNFEKIAELYCHSTPEVQQLFEDSALVIVDFDKAIADGYVKMTKAIHELYENDNGE